MKKTKNGGIIKNMYPDSYIGVEPQPAHKRIEVVIAYGLLDGLYDSIMFFQNGKMRYTPSFCTFDLDIEGIKKATE